MHRAHTAATLHCVARYVLQKDFDLHTHVKEGPWAPLPHFEKEAYVAPTTEFVRQTAEVKGKDGVLAIKTETVHTDFVVPVLKPGENILTPLPFFDKEKPPHRKVIPGDMSRHKYSQYVSTMRTSLSTTIEKRRFLSPREWEHILKAAEEDKDGERVGVDNDAGAEAGPAKQVTFLTADPEEMEAAEAEAETNTSRPWLNKGGGTWRPRPGGSVQPKALRVKPKFDPSSYIAKIKQRQHEDAQHRMNALLVGKDPATDPTKWKMRYRERENTAIREARARAIRAVPKWDSGVVTKMLDASIKTEGYKLQALDQLLMDITKGRRSNEQSAQQKVVPTREYIHKVRQRISDLREAASFVRKQTWHEDLKSLRVGGTHGTPLDDFLTLVKAIIDEDANIFDDTPD